MSDWYYSHDGEQKGPVPASELERLASSGGFDRDKDLVWREGMADWLPVSSVPELQTTAPVQAGESAPEGGATAPTTTAAPNPYATPGSAYAAVAPSGQLPKVKPVSFALIAGTFIIGMIGFIYGYVLLIPELESMAEATGVAPDFPAQPFVILLGSMVPLLISLVLACICIYRAWTLLQPHTSFSTPGKAVGFMFIPFFNLYWYFVAYWRWSQEWNRIVRSNPDHPQSPRINEGLFLTYAIANAASIIPVVGSLAGLVSIVLFLVCIKGMCDAVNYAADQ